MKKTILILVSIATSAVFAAVTIRDTSRSFEFGGGGAIISTDGSGTWTASADVAWLTITTTSGNAGKGVPYLVEANNTADVRVGHITVAGNVYTVTQSGRMVELSPAAVEVGSGNTSGEIALVTDANVTWTVRSAEKWITVSPMNGTGPATLAYTIQPFNGVGSRSGSITVGSQTIPVTQTGIDVNLSPVSTNVSYTVTMIPVIVDAMADQTWTVKQNDSWLSIVDAGTGRGGSQVMLCAAENPSYEKRTGTVSIGTGKVTVTQDGTSDLSFKILPEVATASPLGAFGNVAVYATPDATWTAESLADWIHISSGEAGAGNGNVKYVANANLDLTPRTGQIKFTPPAVVPDVDLYRGLLFWIKDQKNIEGNEERKTTYPLSKVFDGSFYNALSGAALPKTESVEFALAFSFKFGEKDCLNRLLKIGRARHFYFTEDNQGRLASLDADKGYSLKKTVDIPMTIDSGAWYTIVITQDADRYVRIFGGVSQHELSLRVSYKDTKYFGTYENECPVSNIAFGTTDYPSTGNLQSGQFANIRFWTRALTDRECECVDTKQNELVDNAPKGIPSGVKYDYFPLQGNMFGADEAWQSLLPATCGIVSSGWMPSEGRNRLSSGALQSSGKGKIVISNFTSWFNGGYTANGGKPLSQNAYGYRSFSREDWQVYQAGSVYYYYYNYYPEPVQVSAGSECSASYSMWVRLSEFPVDSATIVCRKSSPENDARGVCVNKNGQLMLAVGKDGRVCLKGSDFEDFFVSNKLQLNQWYHLALVGVSGKSITLYLNGMEVGSIASGMSLGYIPPVDQRVYEYCSDNGKSSLKGAVVPVIAELTVGGWKGASDDLAIYHKALSAKEIKAIYNAGVVDDIVYHTVTQGVIEPTLSTYSVNMPKGGGNANVSLTLAKGVNWTATTSASWLSIAGDTSGAGSAEFTIKVAANPTVKTRTGAVTIAGKTVKVTQEPLACEVICDNPVFGTAGDMGTIVVNPELGGSWTATTDEDWIYIVDGESGTGSGDVWFITEGYDDTTGSRTGVIKIGEEKVYITQRGFELSIDPMVAEVGGNAGAGRIGVSADLNAVWTALAQEDWIEIVTGGEGIGDGTVVYRVKDNTTGQTRTGHIYISGQVYTITQTCTLKLTASVVGNGSVNGAGDYSQGKEVTLRAVPDAGSVFSHWSGDVVGNDDVTTVKMDSVKNVTATFIPEAAAQKLAEQKAAQGGFYTRDQIHALEMGNLVFDVDASGTARVGVQLMETSDLSDPNSWKPATLNGNPDVGQDGTVGMKVKAEGNAKFFKVVMPEQK